MIALRNKKIEQETHGNHHCCCHRHHNPYHRHKRFRCHKTSTHAAPRSPPRHANLAVPFRVTPHRNARLQIQQLFLAYHTTPLVSPHRPYPAARPACLLVSPYRYDRVHAPPPHTHVRDDACPTAHISLSFSTICTGHAHVPPCSHAAPIPSPDRRTLPPTRCAEIFRPCTFLP